MIRPACRFFRRVLSIGGKASGAVNNPLIADLAPEHLMGRYMALRTSAWQLGFLAGPAIGSLLLARSPTGLWAGAATACAIAAAGFLVLERSPAALCGVGRRIVRVRARLPYWRRTLIVGDA